MKKNNFYLLFFLCLIAAFLFFPRTGKPVKAFFINGTNRIGHFFVLFGQRTKGSFSFIGQIAHLKQENDFLVNKITELEVDKSKITELEVENKTLKGELGFVSESGINELIPAKITMREPTSFLDNIIIDKGKNDGVREGTAVLSSGTLIGQVKETYNNTAKVVLVTSKDSLVQAMLQGSRSKGILRGGISGLFLENIIQDTEYSSGEYVVTSGLGGKIKQGILIGRAGKIQSTTSGIFKSIAVDPIADMSKLELVFIEK